MKRKVSLISVLLLLALVVTACGGSASGPASAAGSGASNPAGEQAAPGTSDASPAEQGPREIVVTHEYGETAVPVNPE